MSKTEPRTDIDSYKICTLYRGPNLSGRCTLPGRSEERLASQYTPCRLHHHDHNYTCLQHKGLLRSKCYVSALPHHIGERSSWLPPCQAPPGRKRHQETYPIYSIYPSL